MRKLKQSKYGYYLLAPLLILVAGTIRLGYAQNIVNPPNTSDVSESTVGKNAYLSSDQSAFNSVKVTFGYSNTASFIRTHSMNSSVKISSGSLSDSSAISPLLYGANEIWYDNGYGLQDPSSNQTYESVISATKNIGLSVLRFPGGIPSDTYHWMNAIGPQNSRSDNVVYQANDTFLPSNFGPDEFGQLLQSTGAVGNITVNFGTGTAQEAADWVQYMTAPSTGNKWGELRAKNGHPAPYKIPYWEVGNEQQTLELYWRLGSVVTIGDGDGACKSSDIHLCEYVYGGTTRFSDQLALSQANTKVSNGQPGQIYFAKYPPVAVNSQTLYVNGDAWKQVANLSNTSATDKVYALDNATGKITFGDGVHGAILPSDARVSISYDSGPHDGFIQFYKLMKAADPSANICSSYDSSGFMQLMGNSSPYDCIVTHYYGQKISSLADTNLFHDILMQQSFSFSNSIQTTRANLNKYAGKRAKDIQIAVTEYGVNALTSPLYQSNYHRSMDIALFVANSLRIFINNHLPLAEKHYLISYENSSPYGPQTFFNSTTFANNAIIGGPGNDLTIQPTGYVLEAYSKLLYHNLISSKITNNPNTVFSNGSYPSLQTIATTDNKGNEAIMVINLSSSSNVLSEVIPSISSYKHAVIYSLGANNILAYNTPSDPQTVSLVKSKANLHDGKLLGYFPPSSITVIQLSH